MKGLSNVRLGRVVDMTCSSCGKEFDLTDYTYDSAMTKIMKESELCHHCAFWKELIEYPVRPFEIVDGELWVYGTKMSFLDQYRRISPKYILMKDGSTKKIDLPYYVGKIPEEMKDIYKDTASFLTKVAYEKINRRHGLECRAVGCYDRYHCYWYNVKEREPNGPWNEIPPYHKVGNEDCRYFLNKEEIFLKNIK